MPQDKSTDAAKIPELMKIASDDTTLQEAQSQASDKLMSYCGEEYPHNGCAITLSCLLQKAGIDVDDTFLAFELDQVLRDRGWKQIDLGDHKDGDVGTTCGDAPRHGVDHIFLVLKRQDDDLMTIADNQKDVPHDRYVSGKNKSPTTYFLRAT